VVDYQRVLDTQRDLTVEEDLLTSTSGDIIVNLIAMYKALGGGWQIREGQDFVKEETREEMEERTNWGKLLSPEEVEQVSDEEKKMLRAPDW
jgi:hypothetical protein